MGTLEHPNVKQEYSADWVPLKTDSNLVTNAKDKATVLNQQFSSVFTIENMSQKLELGLSPYDPIQPLKITRNGVKHLTKIKADKVTGPDKLPATFLKEKAEPLSGMFFIYQEFLGNGLVPNGWRKANVVDR